MVVVEAAARATPSVVVVGEDNAATELLLAGVNGEIAASSDPQAVAEAIVRVHEGGLTLRESTADWFKEHAGELSIESSLSTVLAGYRAPAHGVDA
jgi:glycosyltransferase involved in cell wall biosynthesis